MASAFQKHGAKGLKNLPHRPRNFSKRETKSKKSLWVQIQTLLQARSKCPAGTWWIVIHGLISEAGSKMNFSLEFCERGGRVQSNGFGVGEGGIKVDGFGSSSKSLKPSNLLKLQTSDRIASLLASSRMMRSNGHST